jgi:hypothetical protein
MKSIEVGPSLLCTSTIFRHPLTTSLIRNLIYTVLFHDLHTRGAVLSPLLFGITWHHREDWTLKTVESFSHILGTSRGSRRTRMLLFRLFSIGTLGSITFSTSNAILTWFLAVALQPADQLMCDHFEIVDCCKTVIVEERIPHFLICCFLVQINYNEWGAPYTTSDTRKGDPSASQSLPICPLARTLCLLRLILKNHTWLLRVNTPREKIKRVLLCTLYST